MDGGRSLRRLWLYPMTALAAVAVVVFTSLYVIDLAATGGPAPGRADGFADYFFFDQDTSPTR
jgi:hypothetical protein